MEILRKLILTIVLLSSAVAPAYAHCDSIDGPVVKAAQKALEAGNVNYVLRWVMPEQEAEVKAAFEQTLAVRTLSSEARTLADRYFFETVVRLHREGEGAPYTGLKPAGRDLGPAIPAADEALETGSIDELRRLLLGAVEEGLEARFHEAYALSAGDPADVETGRAFVGAYVEYIHYAERLYEAAHATEHSHPEEGSL